MDSCYLSVNHNEILNKIKKAFQKTNLDVFKYIAVVAEDGEIKPGFITHCKKLYGKRFNINTASAIKLADAAIDFFAHERWDINNMSKKQAKNDNGYYNISDREKGKQHCAVMVLDVFNQIREGVISKNNANTDYYANAVKDKWNNLIFEEIARINNDNAKSSEDYKTVKDVKEEWEQAEDKLAYVTKHISSTGELTIQNQNRLAVYKELNGTEEHLYSYISEVMANPILSNARTGNLEIEEEDEVEYENSDSESNGNRPEEDLTHSEQDEYMKQFDHSGEHKDFKSHISARLQDYFNALRKFTSIRTTNNGNYAEDLNNNFGIAETMTVEACSSILLQSQFRNQDEFIEAVDRISKTVDGFQSFAKFKEDLQADPDFLCECFTVFAKTKVSKLEVRFENGKSSSIESNSDADKKSSFLFNLQNDMRHTIVSSDIESNEILLSSGKEKAIGLSVRASRLNTIKDEENREQQRSIFEEEYNKLESDIISVVKSFFTSIEEGAILSYINDKAKSNSISDKADVIKDLFTKFRSINDALKNCKEDYNKQQILKQQVTAYNNSLLEKAKNGIYSDEEDYIDMQKVYDIDPLDKARNIVLEIRDMFLDYSYVQTTFNSADVYKNLSSDILNNSMITNLIKLLESGNKEEVLNWGTNKLKAIKNRYNPIFVTQVDSNGRELSKGIFKYNNGVIMLEEDALETLKFYLFNGSINYDNGKAAKYNKMTPGDFVPTILNAYFNQPYTKTKKQMGVFYLRTPSDAPKTFAIRAPRIDTSDLFVFADKNTVANTVKDIVSAVTKKITKEQYDIVTEGDEGFASGYKISHTLLNNILTKKTPLQVKNKNYIIHKKDKDYILLQDESDNKYFVITGKSNEFGYFSNINIEGTFEYRKTEEGIRVFEATLKDDTISLLSNYYTEQLAKGPVTVGDTVYGQQAKVINHNSAAYQLILNQFKQELLSAAVARDVLFECENDGSIKKENGVPVRTKLTGVKFYHTDKEGNVYTKKGQTLSLSGKVFGSNKFTLFAHDKDGKGYTRNYMSDLFKEDATGNVIIDFFYGGAKQENGLHIKKDSNTNNIIDIELTEAQLFAIQERLDSWIKDYVDSGNEFLSEYKDFLGERKLTYDDVINFSINYHLVLCAHDGILDGDSKFYPNAQTILKRAKEYQGSGIPYGVVDYINELPYRTEIVEKTLLDKGTITTGVDEEGNPIKKTFSEIFAGTQLEGLKIYNKFRAVTVKNTQATNEEALQNIKAFLLKHMSKHNINAEEKAKVEDRIDDMLYGPKDEKGVRRGGFTETKVNDAQSYITLEEFVRRVAAKGQLRKYIPMLQKLMFSPETLTAKDIEAFIQVQKNFYYDLHYDENYKEELPRQIKNAELVLVPYFIKGTQLEEVYNMMKEAGIDQLNTVETSKAANEKVLTLWDNDGQISKEKFKSFVAEAKEAMQLYDYNYLYTQQETPQHMNSTNKAGIQIVKKIIDNITKGISTKELYDKKLEYFDLFVENVYGSYEKLVNDLDIEFNEVGEIVNINNKVLLSKLKGELVRRGLDKNMNDYVTLVNGQPRMNPCINSIITTYESIIQGFINRNITRQTLPGFHAAQVTNVGYTALDLSLLPDEKLIENEKFKVWAAENNKEVKDKVSSKLRKEFKEYLKEKGTEVSYDSDLRYHPIVNGKQEHYIEVKVPLSYLGINKNSKHYRNMSETQILEELSKEGLDMLIGYRIPTEGKQSVAIMKVVGILNDAQGSTIVVPNDWVSQTGSDFDIDSVYAITFESYTDSNGIKHRIKYKDYEKEGYTLDDYFYYLKGKIEDIEELKESKEDKKSKIKEFNTLIQDRYIKYKTALAVAEDNLLEHYKKGLYNLRKKAREKVGRSATAAEYEYAFGKAAIDYTTQYVIKNKKYLDKHIQDEQNIQTYLNALIDYVNEVNIQPGERAEHKYAIDNEYKERLEAEAKKNGLPTFEEFKTLPNYKINNRRARNNRILEIMIDIMNDPNAIEEQMLRSNFDDIIAALNRTMSDEVRAERNARSSYNIYDQIKFQNDAMSGATLKAISVSLDTFCSVCNTVRPLLAPSDEILVIYDTDTVLNLIDENAFELKTSARVPKGYLVTHNTYGHSKNNKNIIGRILTAYSSETTAHILDAIKEGAVPNVNEFTFGVYKTLANVGVDYDTIISFITQPAITRIVKAYNGNKSIFSNSFSTPFNIAIKELAKELGVTTEGESITNILNKLQEKYGAEFTEIFKVNDKDPHINLSDNNLKNIAIIGSKLLRRLNNQGEFSSPVEDNEAKPTTTQLLFDLGVMLAFYKINNTATEIGAIARCCNPDKFGAKQSIYAARKTLNDISNSIYRKNTFTKKEVTHPVLSVNGVHILESIYPGISEGVFSFVRNNSTSSYPILTANLKYATAFDVMLSEHVLDTERKEFVDIIDKLAPLLTNNFNKPLSEELQNDYKKYVLSYLLNTLDVIAHPITFTVNEDGTYSMSLDINKSAYDEKQRIFGYGASSNIATIEYEKYTVEEDGKVVEKTKRKEKIFKVEDKNNPTNEELSEFSKLSPAQKVKWIQLNSTNPGIFGYLDVNLNVQQRRGKNGMHTIDFNDNNIDINVIRLEFMLAANSKNPFIAATAVDLVKYATIVEGMRMSKNAVNKVIDNEILYKDFGIDDIKGIGLGINGAYLGRIKAIGTNMSPIAEDEVREMAEMYLRSHLDINEIGTLKLNKTTRAKYNIQGPKRGMYICQFNPKNNATEEELKKAKDEYNSKLTSAKILKKDNASNTYYPNSYIKIVDFNGDTRLYRIINKGGFIAMYPLITLETNEFGIWSANEENNKKSMDKGWYESILTAYSNQLFDNTLFSEIADGVKEEFKESGKYDELRYKKRATIKGKILADTNFNINSTKFKDDISINNLKNIVRSRFINELNSKPIYVICSSLESYIPSTGELYGLQQTITYPNGESVKVQITKVTPNAKIKEELPTLNNGNSRYLYKITPILNSSDIQDDPNMESSEAAISLPDINAGVLDFMKGQVGVESDPVSREFMNHIRLAADGQVSASVEFSKNNELLVTREIAAYVGKVTDILKNKIENFTRDPEDEDKWLSILDDKVQSLLGKKPELLNEYIRVSNLANALHDKLAHYNQQTSEDSEVQFYIDEIKKTITEISKLPIDKIEQKIAEGYFTSISTNPLIKGKQIPLINGYYRTQGFMWQYDDIMNASNPLVQTIMRDVMDDIEQRRLAKARYKEEYRKQIETFEKEAAAKGLSININKFITDDGEFIEDYVRDFKVKYDELEDAVIEASKQGYGTIEHLKAKLAFDQIKAVFINQEAKPEYYIQKTNLEQDMLENYPEIYSEYMKFLYERNLLNQYIQERGSSNEQTNKLKKLDLAIINLYRPGYYIDESGNFVSRPIKQFGAAYTEAQKKELALYGDEAATALNNFLGNMKELRERTFEYVPVPKFKELLKINLDVIAKAEQRTPDGIPTIPMSQLMQNARYVEARNWVKNNAAFIVNYDNDVDDFGKKVNKALNKLKLGKNRKSLDISRIISNAETDTNRAVRDYRGVLNGNEFTEDEVRRVKKLQEQNMQLDVYPPFSDAVLINSAKGNGDIFKKEFYEKMTGNGVKASEYRTQVTNINALLERCWNPVTDRLDFTMLEDNAENIKLLTNLGIELLKLRTLKRKEGSTNMKEVVKFIEENTVSVPDEDAFAIQKSALNGRSIAFKNALASILYEVDVTGDYVRDKNNELVANSLLFNYIRPKAEKYINGQLNPEYTKWVDEERTEANRILEGLYRTVPTQYYHDARREAELESKRRKDNNAYYAEWIEKNHVWNPYTRKVEPLQIWTRSEYKYENFEENSADGEWVPRRHQRERKVKDGMKHGLYIPEADMRNLAYRPNTYILGNYRPGAYDGRYDNPKVAELNEYEIKMRNYLKQTLINSAKTYQGKHYFEQGNLPAARKADQMTFGKVVKEFGKLAGIGTFAKESDIAWKNDISYSEDFNPVMPMTEMLKDSNKGSIYFDKPKPTIAAFDGDVVAYTRALAEWKDEKKQVEEQNREIHKALLDKNWIDVIERYLDKACDYNAILHNKQKLFYLLDQVRKQETYIINDGSPVENSNDTSTRGKITKTAKKLKSQAREFVSRTPEFQRNARKSSDDNPIYDTDVDKNLYEQLSNVVRRLLYDQWVRPDIKQGIARNLQGFTSANYMMLNFRGGIANVTLGETGILAEAAASEYFNKEQWGTGTLEWTMGVFSYSQGFAATVAGHEDWAYSKQDAAIKYFKSVDYDEKTGTVRELDYAKYSKILRDSMFSPQTIGEHFMQNSVLFAMLHSHKLVENKDDARGIGFTFMNKAEYIRVKEAEYLTDILNEEQQTEFANFKKEISATPNDFREYAWFRKNDITEWVARHLDKKQRSEWAKKVEENRKKLSDEFDNMPDIYSQIDLGDNHKLKFVEGSILEKLSHEFTETGISYAEHILGQLSNRVRLVNNKIHGNYNRNAAAYIESKWWGALVMQYHKHLPTGILKRWRRRGYYNETRGTVEKGIVASCMDFLSLNAEVAQKNCGLTQPQTDAIKSAQFMLRHIFDFCAAIKDTWAITPDYDKANIRRNAGDLSGVLIALLVALALQVGGDDDDDSLFYNLALYEADRLASESFMYNPIGGVVETKKLMSTPVAGQSVISDMFKTAMVVGDMILKGEDYDPYYHSGRFADEHKLSVYIQRRTPIWAGIRNLLDTPDNNHYYKLGKNPIGIVDIEAIANWIKK